MEDLDAGRVGAGGEAGDEAAGGLGCERDLGDEDDGGSALGEGALDEVDVDLGLAGAGDAAEEVDGEGAFASGGVDAVDDALLIGGESGDGGGVGEENRVARAEAADFFELDASEEAGLGEAVDWGEVGCAGGAGGGGGRAAPPAATWLRGARAAGAARPRARGAGPARGARARGPRGQFCGGRSAMTAQAFFAEGVSLGRSAGRSGSGVRSIFSTVRAPTLCLTAAGTMAARTMPRGVR